ncbi:MAG: hypothetical protein JXR53_06335 [Bacteroidales bacterium]|nr:hypothetical protein [Bacteroidales bacterium]
MKLIILSFSILVMIFSSCTKNTDVEQITNDLRDVQNKSEWGLTKELFVDFGGQGDIDCYPSSTPNCFDVIIIIGSTEQEEMFNNLLPEILEDDREAVVSFFESYEYEILFPLMPEDNLSNLIQGSEYLLAQHPVVDNTTIENEYLIMFVNSENEEEISLVYQFEVD